MSTQTFYFIVLIFLSFFFSHMLHFSRIYTGKNQNISESSIADHAHIFLLPSIHLDGSTVYTREGWRLSLLLSVCSILLSGSVSKSDKRILLIVSKVYYLRYNTRIKLTADVFSFLDFIFVLVAMVTTS